MHSMSMLPGSISLEEAMSLLDAGKAYSVFIDDTGTAGHGGQEIVRYVAVVVNPEVSPLIPGIMQVAIDEIKQVTGATELHFKDIYHGKGQFEGIPLSSRLAMFRAITSIFVDTIKPTILVQSADPEILPDILKEIARRITVPELPPPLSLNSIHGFTFCLILERICQYIEQVRSGGEQAVVFCDQGILKPRMSLHFPSYSGIIYQGWIHFADSNVERGIQLADFAAFVLNRHQFLGQKQVLSSIDKTFLMITEPLAQFCLNVDVRSARIEYDAQWHAAHILRDKLSGTDKNILVVDTRTGESFVLGPDAPPKHNE